MHAAGAGWEPRIGPSNGWLTATGVLAARCAEVAESKTAKSRRQLEKARASPPWLTRKQRQRLKSLLFWSFLVAGLLALVLIGVQENKARRLSPVHTRLLRTREIYEGRHACTGMLLASSWVGSQCRAIGRKDEAGLRERLLSGVCTRFWLRQVNRNAEMLMRMEQKQRKAAAREAEASKQRSAEEAVRAGAAAAAAQQQREHNMRQAAMQLQQQQQAARAAAGAAAAHAQQGGKPFAGDDPFERHLPAGVSIKDYENLFD